MTCRRCGGPITESYCEDCGLLAARPPVFGATSAPERRPIAPSISRNGWAPRAAPVKERRFIARPVPKLMFAGVVVLLAALGWFVVRSPDAPAQGDLTSWKVGACVRITTDTGDTWPVLCEVPNDGVIVRQVSKAEDCPGPAQWWVARGTDGFCVRRTGVAPSRS